MANIEKSQKMAGMQWNKIFLTIEVKRRKCTKGQKWVSDGLFVHLKSRQYSIMPRMETLQNGKSEIYENFIYTYILLADHLSS